MGAMKPADLSEQLCKGDFSSGHFYSKIILYYGDNTSYLTEQKSRIANLLTAFSKTFETSSASLIHAPGRTNLIGEHTDYNGYPVMPMAINRDILVCASSQEESIINVVNVDTKFEPRTFSINENIKPYTPGDWGNYVKAAIVGLLPIVIEKNKHVKGFSAVYSGIIPPAGGLSSSSAMVVASALTFLHANNIKIPEIELAEILARAERFVGTEGGGMDQAISLMGEKNKAIKIDFFPLRTTPISLPDDYEIVICNSLVRAPKTEAAMIEYNRRPVECRLAAALVAKELEKVAGHQISAQRLADVDQRRIDVDEQTYQKAVMSALDSPVYSAELLQKELALSRNELDEKYLRLKSGKLFIPPPDGFKVGKRQKHVLSEAQRVEQAAEALHSGDITEFGKLMNASHESCRTDYEISTPELDKLVEIARHHGAIGARLTGAGFGGSTVNLVPKNDVAAFIKGVIKDYYQDYLPSARPDIQFKTNNLKNIVFSSSAVAGAEVMIE